MLEIFLYKISIVLYFHRRVVYFHPCHHVIGIYILLFV